MIKQIFNKLNKNNTNKILKVDLIEYLYDKEDLLKMYNLDTANITREINRFTAHNSLTIEEFSSFLKQPRKVKEIKKDQNYFAEEIRTS